MELDKASKSGGDIIPFLQYAIQGFVEGLREQLEVIRQQQWDVSWSDYVHEMFADNKSPASLRQLAVVLALSSRPTAIPISGVPGLSPSIAKAYAKKTLRTVQRDISALEKMKLVERVSDGVRAKPETILAFLPRQATPLESIAQSSSSGEPPQPELNLL